MAESKPLRKVVSASLALHTYMVLGDVATKRRWTISALVNKICEDWVAMEDRQRAMVKALKKRRFVDDIPLVRKTFER